VTIKISAKFHPLIYRLPPNITHPFEENAKLEETHNSKNSKKKKKKNKKKTNKKEERTEKTGVEKTHSELQALGGFFFFLQIYLLYY